MMDDNKYQSEILDAYDEGFNDGYQTAYEKYKYELAQLELKRDKKFKLGMLVNKKILDSNVVHYCPFVMFKEVIEQYNKIYFYILQEIKTIIEELSDNPENK